MINLELDKLTDAIEDQKLLLKHGLIAVDVFDSETGLTLVGFNSQPSAVAMFTSFTKDLTQTLRLSGYPDLGEYFMVELQDSRVGVIQFITDRLWSSMLLDADRVNLGMTLDVVIPRFARGVQAALPRDPARAEQLPLADELMQAAAS